jgi:uncharacterized protein
MIIGWMLAIFIGLSLGLLGGGGSILTVPILVYAFNIDPKTSIALSLAIVGITSLIGTITHFRAGNVELKTVAVFAPLAMIGTFTGAKLSVFFSGEAQLVLFGIIMLLASVFMLKESKYSKTKEKANPLFLGFQGFIVGIITGIIGIGGGFLIVPALVILAQVPMKQAVGTSLFVIFLNSISGFIGYLGMVTIDWFFLGKFILATGFGIILGTYLVKYIPPAKLKKIFAIFLIFMGIFILYKNRETLGFKVTSFSSPKSILTIF